MEKTFGVWCRVSGGVTGTREAWLKVNIRLSSPHTSGEVWRGTEEEARAKAAELSNVRPSPYQTATFHYEARKL